MFFWFFLSYVVIEKSLLVVLWIESLQALKKCKLGHIVRSKEGKLCSLGEEVNLIFKYEIYFYSSV